MRTTPLLALFLALSTPASAQTEEPPKKLAVVPFAALSGDVPQRAGAKAAGMLSTELRNTEKVQLVDVKRAAAADPHAEGLGKARAAVEQAKEQRKKRKFRLAEESLQKALADYRAAAGGVTDVGEVVDAWALLAAVQYNTGKDEEGLKSLQTALSLAPSRELPLAQTSALFAKLTADTRKAVLGAPKGSLLIESSPSHAAVFVDGVPLGSTPLLVKDVPAGAHLWRVTMPSGEHQGGLVEVASGKPAKASAQSHTKDPESRILAGLSQNKLDDQLLSAAKEHAKNAEAEWLLFGALSKEGKGLALDSFLFSAANGELKRLPRAAFDTELLSAGMEFYNLAGQLAQKGIKVGEGTKVPGPVLAGAMASLAKTTEVPYGVQAGKEPTLDEPAMPTHDEGGAKKPLDPNKSRAPLKKK